MSLKWVHHTYYESHDWEFGVRTSLELHERRFKRRFRKQHILNGYASMRLGGEICLVGPL